MGRADNRLRLVHYPHEFAESLQFGRGQKNQLHRPFGRHVYGPDQPTKLAADLRPRLGSRGVRLIVPDSLLKL